MGIFALNDDAKVAVETGRLIPDGILEEPVENSEIDEPENMNAFVKDLLETASPVGASRPMIEQI